MFSILLSEGFYGKNCLDTNFLRIDDESQEKTELVLVLSVFVVVVRSFVSAFLDFMGLTESE